MKLYNKPRFKYFPWVWKTTVVIFEDSDTIYNLYIDKGIHLDCHAGIHKEDDVMSLRKL